MKALCNLLFGSVEKSIVSDEIGIEFGRCLGSTWTSGVIEIDVVQSEALRVTEDPLKVVQ